MTKQEESLYPFLTRHVPSQISNTQKLCYRHRPDLVKNRGPDNFNISNIQQQMEKLATSDREAISHIWSLFSAAPADQRTLILKGLVSTCCMPQLSFLHSETKPLLRIDFVSVLPKEIALSIFSLMDATSLCHAAQVSQRWKKLADDDSLWHKMCEQHIDKKCSKCGWGLPLLNKSRSIRKRPITTQSPLQVACGPTALVPIAKRQKINSNTENIIIEPIDTNYPTTTRTTTNQTQILRRPWKDVYSERLMVERNWRNNKYNVITLHGHNDGVMCVQFCEILKIIITGSFDKTVRVWDLETGQEKLQLIGHSRCVRALQFDDAKLVTGAMDNTLKIWNYHTGQCIRTLEGHTGGILSLHFDSRILASGSTDNTIRVWNFEAGECCTLSGHTEWVNSVKICHDGAMLVSSSDDATIRLWDLQSRSCTRVYRGHVGQVQMALPSLHGFTHRLNTAAINENASNTVTNLKPNVLQTPGCSSTSRDTISHATAPNNVQSFNEVNTNAEPSDSPIIISSALDNTIKIWDSQSGQCLRTLFGHVQGIWALAFDKLRIVSGSHDKTLRVWDTESGRCLYALEGHHGPVTAVALSDTRIVSAADDGEVKIWNFGMI
ncbi:WD40-repeat-containing domain protein [Mucor mucedo]|uniref:WD40-repeat-containing domain protein n=1 Tax=Mucor mucedo TaxID=29922 RepID=UPI00221FE3A6|nr:WD40-repeat-containing domain protein [Mucor mucedo]KAI7886867.1 WD40-repeat-containing domain protein [Mucor mucedo]